MKNKSVKGQLRSQRMFLKKSANWSSEKFASKDQQVYNNCYELRSRAIKKFLSLLDLIAVSVDTKTGLSSWFKNLSNTIFYDFYKQLQSDDIRIEFLFLIAEFIFFDS